MIVMIVKNTRPRLTGELGRWLCEVEPGVFVGAASGRVADHLWRMAGRLAGDGYALQLLPDRSRPTGFRWRRLGAAAGRLELVEVDGVTLSARVGNEKA